MVEVSLLICLALLLPAYFHAHHFPGSEYICALFALTVIALYCGWLCVRAEVKRRVMETVEAAKEVYRRVERRVEEVYDSIAEGAFEFGQDFERLARAIYDTPTYVKWGLFGTTIAVQLALLMCRAWYLEEEEQLLTLFAWSCGGILVLVVCWRSHQEEHGELESECVQEMALVPYTPPEQRETPVEKRRKAREAKHEANSAQMRRSYQKEQDRLKWESEHRDGNGDLPIWYVAEQSPRASPGVHMPKPIVFPEDLSPETTPKPQPKAIPSLPPLPEPESEPSSEDKAIALHQYEHDREWWQMRLGLPRTPLSCAGNCPWDKKSAVPSDVPPEKTKEKDTSEGGNKRKDSTGGASHNPKSPKGSRKNSTEDDSEPKAGTSGSSGRDPNSGGGPKPSSGMRGGNESSRPSAGSRGQDDQKQNDKQDGDTGMDDAPEMPGTSRISGPETSNKPNWSSYPDGDSEPKADEKPKPASSLEPQREEKAKPFAFGNGGYKPQSDAKPMPFPSANTAGQGGISFGSNSTANGLKSKSNAQYATGASKSEPEGTPQPFTFGDGPTGASFGTNSTINSAGSQSNAGSTTGSFKPKANEIPKPSFFGNGTGQKGSSITNINGDFTTHAPPATGSGFQANAASTGPNATFFQSAKAQPSAQNDAKSNTNLPGLSFKGKAPMFGSASEIAQSSKTANSTAYSGTKAQLSAQNTAKFNMDRSSFTTGKDASVFGSASGNGKSAANATGGASNMPSGFSGPSATSGSTSVAPRNPSDTPRLRISGGWSKAENRAHVKATLQALCASFAKVNPQNPLASMSPPMDQKAFNLECDKLCEATKQVYDWVHPKRSKGWDQTKIDPSSDDDCCMGTKSGGKLWTLRDTLNTLFDECDSELPKTLSDAVRQLNQLWELFENAFPPLAQAQKNSGKAGVSKSNTAYEPKANTSSQGNASSSKEPSQPQPKAAQQNPFAAKGSTQDPVQSAGIPTKSSQANVFSSGFSGTAGSMTQGSAFSQTTFNSGSATGPSSNPFAKFASPDMSQKLSSIATGGASGGIFAGNTTAPKLGTNPFAFAQVDMRHKLPSAAINAAPGGIFTGAPSASSQPIGATFSFNGAAASGVNGAQAFPSGDSANSSQNLFGSTGTTAAPSNAGRPTGAMGSGNGRQEPSSESKSAQVATPASTAQAAEENPLISDIITDQDRRRMLKNWNAEMVASFLRKKKPDEHDLKLTRKRLDWIREWAAPGNKWDSTRVGRHNFETLIGTGDELFRVADRIEDMELDSEGTAADVRPCKEALERLRNLMKAQRLIR